MSTSPVSSKTDRPAAPTPDAPSAKQGVFLRALKNSGTTPPRAAGPGDKAPALSDYASIGKPGAQGADTVVYVTADGERVLVARSTSPALYEQVLADAKVLPTVQARLAEGYTLAGADGQAPAVLAGYAGVPERLSDRLLAYSTPEGKVLVDVSRSPELAKQVKADLETLAALDGSVAQGYERAGSERAPEAADNYLNIGPPDETGPGVIRYETQDGHKVVIAERENPEAYAAAKKAYQALAEVNQRQAEGYRAAAANEAPPPYVGTDIEAPGKGGTLSYRHGDDKVVVDPHTNPALYAYLEGMRTIEADPGRSSAVQGALDGGASLAGLDAKAPKLNDYQEFHWQVGEEGNVLSYQTHDGQNVVVSRDLTPELFEQVKADKLRWDKIHASENEGYTLAGPNDFMKGDSWTIGPPDELTDGLIRYETPDQGKVIVSRDLSPQLYQEVLDRWDAMSTKPVDDTRAKYELKPESELDILAMGTGQHGDGDNGPELNVQELATKDLIDGYKKGVEDGSIGKDDPRAQLVRALEAQAAYQNGRGVTGYEEATRPFNTTWRESDDKQTQLTSADMHDFIDGPKLQERLTALFDDPTIQKDYADKLNGALERIPDKDKIKQNLIDTLNSDDYTRYLDDLKGQGRQNEASQDVNRMLAALNVLDPEEGKKAAQRLQVNALTSDLNELVDDPSKIEQSVKNKAAGDLFTLIKSILSSSAGISRQTYNSIDGFIKEFAGDAKLTEVTKAIEELQTKFKNGEMVTADDISKAVQKPYVPLEDRGKIAGFLGTLNNAGILGSFSGALSLVSGIYTLTKGGEALASDPLARLGVARDFINFLSMGPQFAKLFDQGLSVLGKNGVADALGVSKTLKENLGASWIPTWDKPPQISSVPLYVPELPEVTTGVADELRRDGNAIADRVLSEATPPAAPAVPATGSGSGAAGGNDAKGIQGLMDDLANSSKIPPVKSSTGTRIAGSALKTLGALSDGVGGVADIVLGAFSLKSSVASNDKAGIAMGSLQVVSGTMGMAAGGIGIAGLFGSVGAASALTGPLFLGALILGGIAAIAGIFINHNKKQKATDGEGDWYKELAKDGLMQADWAEKLEYARYEIHHYGGRDTPDDDSLFRYQSSEFEHFKDTPQKGGSSSNRLDGTLHKDYVSPEEAAAKAKAEEEQDKQPERPTRGGGGAGARLV
ncbi:hypothetical protein [uncultured Pseudomonas sp.]|uniref:hypothetical protein n=1 Tax=uncultured Pseudomonas sp. TaxID=114707 RepID=UPI00258F5906|nr:hypothetical protein [uncultured Pseudomonas sp.]